MSNQITARKIDRERDQYGRTAYMVHQTTGTPRNYYQEAEVLGRMIKMPKTYTNIYPDRVWRLNNWTTETVEHFASRKEIMASLGLKGNAPQSVWVQV